MKRAAGLVMICVSACMSLACGTGAAAQSGAQGGSSATGTTQTSAGNGGAGGAGTATGGTTTATTTTATTTATAATSTATTGGTTTTGPGGGWSEAYGVDGEISSLAVDPSNDDRIVVAFEHQVIVGMSSETALTLFDETAGSPPNFQDDIGGALVAPLAFTAGSRLIAYTSDSTGHFAIYDRTASENWHSVALGSAQAPPPQFTSWPATALDVTANAIHLGGNDIFDLTALGTPAQWREYVPADPTFARTIGWLRGDPTNSLRFTVGLDGFNGSPPAVVDCALQTAGTFACTAPLPSQGFAADDHGDGEVGYVEPGDANHVYMTTVTSLGGRLYASIDRGASFTPIPLPGSGPPVATRVTALAVHPTISGTLAIATETPLNGQAEEQLWVSADRGQTFHEIILPMPSYQIRAIAIDHQNRIVIAMGADVLRHPLN